MDPASLPDAVKAHPRLGQWLDIGTDGGVRAYSGKVDIGQGISHALRLIVAEELCLPPQRIEMQPASTRCSPDEAVTSGSLSVQHSGAALRCAAAHMRETCRHTLALRHGVAPDAVTLAEGVFRVDGQGLAVDYAALVDAQMLAGAIDPAHGRMAQDAAACHRDSQRPDIAAKVFGEFTFIQDMELPGMCHGRVFRPRTLTAELDPTAAQRLVERLRTSDGILAVPCDGVLIGVIALSEYALARAARQVARAEASDGLWSGRADVPTADGVVAWLKSQPLESSVVLERADGGVSDGTERGTLYRAEYDRAYLQHASVGLCCAIGQWTGGGQDLAVWSHSQGIFNLRRDLALAFGVREAQVQVSHAEGAGCYGHNGADDVAFDAAWLARAALGRPVRALWSRADEMGQAPMGPAMAVAIEARVGPDGVLQSWQQDVWSQGHGTRPGRGATPSLLGAWQTASPFPVPLAVNAALAAGGGSQRNAVPPYDIASLRVLNHRVLAMPLRVSALRALGAHANVFAAESFMDEIAAQQSMDPLAFRLAQLQRAEDARAVAVLTEVARLADWGGSRPATEGWGRGLAYARYKNTGAYCAVVVELVVQASVRLQRIWIAADMGRVVHPDGARNQLEGGAIQAASWTLCEAAQFDPSGIRSTDWESYPILRFRDVPQVQIALLERPDHASVGAGECTAGPVAGAIANAIADATGIRMRSMPFTAERLMQQALAQADG
ncbi:MAG: xanthine dehydrogenase family protein molybdopterin-binding subunit [Rhodoferax sp.]|nr:xanthine dehydrogenase family protein molybdopterin-binding subunit [Rhodoferax sp.]